MRELGESKRARGGWSAGTGGPVLLPDGWGACRWAMGVRPTKNTGCERPMTECSARWAVSLRGEVACTRAAMVEAEAEVDKTTAVRKIEIGVFTPHPSLRLRREAIQRQCLWTFRWRSGFRSFFNYRNPRFGEPSMRGVAIPYCTTGRRDRDDPKHRHRQAGPFRRCVSAT